MKQVANDIAKAMKVLGCKGKVKIERAPFGFYAVYLNGEEYGIWDVSKKTFTA